MLPYHFVKKKLAIFHALMTYLRKRFRCYILIIRPFTLKKRDRIWPGLFKQ
mgnify:CR=1 FL=1